VSTADVRGHVREALRIQWRREGVYGDLTLPEAFAAGAAASPDDQIVFAPVDGAVEVVTLSGLQDRALHRARALHADGVGAGDVVVLQAAADDVGTETLVALWMLGVVVVPLVASAGAVERAHVVDETGATAVLTVDDVHDDDDRPAVPEVLRPSPADAACILYTSGSAAAPKGVVHSHETLLAGVTAVPADGTSRFLATFPAGHVASLLGLLRPLTVGGLTVVMDRWSARHAVALIEEHRLTTSAGTPFYLRTLLDEAEQSGRDLSSLSAFLCGAASVPPSLVERAEAHGIVTWRTYGMTEHPAISAGSPLDPPEKRRLTDGRPGPGNEVRLLNPEGRDVAAGEEGEIVARGPKQFLGYQNAALDDDAFVDVSWFRTGDLGQLDPDGHLVVTDRLKDVIIRGGENISAKEVEDALVTHPAVREVAVLAVPDELWGETVCAVVLPQPGAEPDLGALRAHGSTNGLADHKLPARVIVVDDLPRTAAGKVKKRELLPPPPAG
jgi:acyl-CoA synthetase (AMP-forming)/AMP-acid ligase II